MNSLTTHYRRSQLIALPVPGGKAKVEYCYAVNVLGDREIVTHSFAEWAVGDFNRQKETVLCDKLTAGSKPGGSLLRDQHPRLRHRRAFAKRVADPDSARCYRRARGFFRVLTAT